MSLSGYGTSSGDPSRIRSDCDPSDADGRLEQARSESRRGTLPAMDTLTRSRGPLVVAAVAAVLHLVVGFYYLAGGLVIPGYVLYPLWAVWIGLAWWLVALARRNSWWTPLPPVVAAVLFLVVITVGEQMLGWRG